MSTNSKTFNLFQDQKSSKIILQSQDLNLLKDPKDLREDSNKVKDFNFSQDFKDSLSQQVKDFKFSQDSRDLGEYARKVKDFKLFSRS